MITVLQRVKNATVSVDGTVRGSCREGLLILIGVEKGDTERDADLLADKIGKLRIFCDENDKMNRSVTDIGGSALVISNFTLCADYRHGNRPDYFKSESPAEAERLIAYFSSRLSGYVPVENGVFGADMEVSLLNDGPVTLVLDSAVLKK